MRGLQLPIMLNYVIFFCRLNILQNYVEFWYFVCRLNILESHKARTHSSNRYRKERGAKGPVTKRLSCWKVFFISWRTKLRFEMAYLPLHLFSSVFHVWSLILPFCINSALMVGWYSVWEVGLPKTWFLSFQALIGSLIETFFVSSSELHFPLRWLTSRSSFSLLWLLWSASWSVSSPSII